MSPLTPHRTGIPNYSTNKLVSFVSTLHSDAKALRLSLGIFHRYQEHLYLAVLWYHIFVCIRANIPNCYGSICGPLPHLRVWYSRCIHGYKSSHLSPPLLPDSLVGLSPPSMPRVLRLSPGIIPDTRDISFCCPLVSSHPHWADIPNYRGMVHGPLPHLLVRYSCHFLPSWTDSPNY